MGRPPGAQHELVRRARTPAAPAPRPAARARGRWPARRPAAGELADLINLPPREIRPRWRRAWWTDGLRRPAGRRPTQLVSARSMHVSLPACAPHRRLCWGIGKRLHTARQTGPLFGKAAALELSVLRAWPPAPDRTGDHLAYGACHTQRIMATGGYAQVATTVSCAPKFATLSRTIFAVFFSF